MNHSVQEEKRKVRPLNTISAGTPKKATKKPPAALPSICKALRVPLISDIPRMSSPGGVTCGSRLLTAGCSTLAHTALTAATASTCQTCILPCQASAPSASITTPQTRSLPAMRVRLRQRSASTPPSGCSTSAPK